MAANPATRRVYVANYNGNDLTVIDTVVDAAVATIPLPGAMPSGVVVNPETNPVYVGHLLTYNVTAIDGATNEVIRTMMVGAQPRGMAADPIGNRIYVANSATDSVSVIDGATNAVGGGGARGQDARQCRCQSRRRSRLRGQPGRQQPVSDRHRHQR